MFFFHNRARRRTALGVFAVGGAAILALSSCSAQGTPDGAAGGESGPGERTVVYVQGVTGNPFFTSVTCGAQEAAEAAGIDFSFQGGKDYSPEAQTPVLNAVSASAPDGIIISPMAGDAMVPALKQAKEAGIELVFVDSTASDADLAASFVSSDNEEGGSFAADKVAGLIGGTGKVLILGATPGISTTDARVTGFEKRIEEEYPDIELVETQYSGSTPSGATQKLSGALAADPDIAAVFAVSTQEVEGAVVAIEQADRTGDLTLVGFDTSDPIVEGIEAGSVAGVVVQKPLDMGTIAMEQMIKALDGEETEAVINTDYVFLDQDSLDDDAVSKYIYRTSC